jgi:hypothetical protein
MADTFISISHNGADLNRWVDDIAKRQIPFGTAKALTDMTGIIGLNTANRSRQTMDIRAGWAGTFRPSRVGAENNPSTSAAFTSVPADRKKPIAEMEAHVGTTSWALKEQIGIEAVTRRMPSNAKGKYLWVPLSKELKGSAETRKKYLKEYASGHGRVFFHHIHSKVFLSMREGASRYPIKSLFRLETEQGIAVRFDFIKEAYTDAHREFPYVFTKAMEYALKTAKK